MSSRRLRGYALSLVAAVAAITLTISGVPASASVTTAGSAQTAARHRAPGQAFRTPDLAGDTICLRNDDSVCLATNGSDIRGTDHIDWHLVIETIHAVYELYELLKTGDSEKTEGEGNEEGDETTAGDCDGGTEYGQAVSFMSCQAAHGIYWQFQSHGGGYRIWNTYTHGFLEVPNTGNGTTVLTGSTSGTWSTWIVFTGQ